MTSIPALDRFIAAVSDHILNPIIGLLFAAALALFAFGGLRLIFNAGDPGARKKGRDHLIWGTIGMFIMASVYGILRLITDTIGVRPPGL